MALIADILLVAGALGAAFYCMMLARRLRQFNDLEKGMGGAIAVLSAQVDEMTNALKRARNSALDSSTTLTTLTDKAEDVAQRLELLVASLHDLPISAQAPASGPTSSNDAGNRPDGVRTAVDKVNAGQAPSSAETDDSEGDPVLRFIRGSNGEPVSAAPFILGQGATK